METGIKTHQESIDYTKKKSPITLIGNKPNHERSLYNILSDNLSSVDFILPENFDYLMRYLSLTERNININYILEEGSVKFLIINLYFIENIKPKSNIKDVIEREIKKHGLDNYNIEDHFDFYTTNPETGYLSMPISSTPFDVSDTNLRELLTYDSVEDGEYLNGAIIIDVSINNLYV